ncbi:MAG: FG-GAP-like repeat-containing protein [Pseudomonadota bacterium]
MRLCLALLLGASTLPSGATPPAPSDLVAPDVHESALTVANLRFALERAGAATPLPRQGEVAPGSPLAKLGRRLFFTTLLSGNRDTACASCHHPLLGGGDAMPLSVGVDALEPSRLGPGRLHDWQGRGSADPRADGGPNVPRNSPTTFNVGLYAEVLFFDGRVERLGPHAIATPDSHARAGDPQAGDTLLAAQARFPVVAHDEMRGFHFAERFDHRQTRDALTARIRQHLGTDASFVGLFRAAFPATPGVSALTFEHIAKALDAYQRSQYLVASPWQQFLRGETRALDRHAKRGAALFYLSPEENGAGCARCHRSQHFSDEAFHNLAVPQVGRGKGPWGTDLGRYLVSGRDEDRFAFRTPSLLNVAVTAPYGHSGAYATLEEMIEHHVNPSRSLARYSFTHAAAKAGQEVVYSKAREHSQAALETSRFATEKRPRLRPNDVRDLVAFLHALTDPCVRDPLCLSPWLPETERPDHLVADVGETRAHLDPDPQRHGPNHEPTPLVPRFADVSAQWHFNFKTGYPVQSDRGPDDSPNFADKYFRTRFGTGLAVGDVDRDGRLDVYVDRGSIGSNLLLRNRGDRFEDIAATQGVDIPGRGARPALIDLTGDGRLDLILADPSGTVRVFAGNAPGFTEQASNVATTRPISGMAFSDIDRDGDLDLFLTHFATHPGPAQSHLWLNDGTGRFHPGGRSSRLRRAFSLDERSLSARFADFNGDRWPDLWIAGDAQAARLFINQRNGTFADHTDSLLLGMATANGQALGDLDNDGDFDWFIAGASPPPGHVGELNRGWSLNGGKLFINDAHRLRDRSAIADLSATHWGTGACLADFNHDGHLDVFVVNGMHRFQDSLGEIYEGFEQDPARLYLARGDGTFVEHAEAAGIADDGIGRGLSCVDIDNDHDVDVLIVNLNGTAKLYRNELSRAIAKRHRAFTVALDGPPGNRGAVGAEIRIRRGGETITRRIWAASDFSNAPAGRQHIGLGAAWDIDELQVVWPERTHPVTRIRQPSIRHQFNLAYPGPDRSPDRSKVTDRVEPDRSPDPLSATRYQTSQTGPGEAIPTRQSESRSRVPIAPSRPPKFVDVTREAGLALPSAPVAPTKHMQPYLAGGAAAGDFDADGWVDLYLPTRNGPDRLYRNLGDGRFVDVTAIAFGEQHLADVQSTGAAWGDIDADGDLDLYVTSIFSSRFHLFINDGNGRFTEEALARGAAVNHRGPHFGFSVTFGDYDGDGDLDIHTTEWRLSTQLDGKATGNARLLQNDGTGHFMDVTLPAGVDLETVEATMTHALGQSFSSHFADIDEDGYPELLVASDNGTSRFFWNNRDGTFSDGTRSANVGTDQYGMGSAVGDYDGDGDLDWFVSSIYQPDNPQFDGNRLYRYEGERRFSDATDEAGVRDAGWGWGSVFFDYDNDSDLDLVVANGIQMSPSLHPPLYAYQHARDRTRLWQNQGGGVFNEVGTALGPSGVSQGRGVAVLDYDRDGDQDLLIVNNDGTPILWRNDSPGQHRYLRIRARGSLSNRRGLGVRIAVTLAPRAAPIVREIGAGNNYLGQSESVAHFGLGMHRGTIHQVDIRWPSGLRQILKNVAPNAEMTVVESEAPPTLPMLVEQPATGPRDNANQIRLGHSSQIRGTNDRSSAPPYRRSLAP